MRRVIYLSLLFLFVLAFSVLTTGVFSQSTIHNSTEQWVFVYGWRVTPPATQTIAAGDTVTANACGGLKRLTSAGAVTTSTTNTFTAPGATNAGCEMAVCNVGSNNITLDNNANFKSIAGADIVLTADDCTRVVSDGTVWRSSGSLVAN